MTAEELKELRERTFQVKDESHLRRLGLDANNLALRKHYFELREDHERLAGNGYMAIPVMLYIAECARAGKYDEQLVADDADVPESTEVSASAEESSEDAPAKPTELETAEIA